MSHAPLAGFFIAHRPNAFQTGRHQTGLRGSHSIPRCDVRKAYEKPALTFEEQLGLLESRGMLFSDRKSAIAALRRISYYRLSAYWHPAKRPDNSFVPGSSFEQVLALYEFDRRLRLLALDAIERVEVQLRTAITYHLGHRYGAFGHTEASNFEHPFKHRTWYAEATGEIQRAKEKFLEHFRQTYVGFPHVPIWMASEALSLGSLSKLYRGMRGEDQRAITATLQVHFRVAASWFHTLTFVRNVCAHHGRLWNRELPIRPKVPKGLPSFAGLNPGRIYFVLCILRQLTRDEPSGLMWMRNARSLLQEAATMSRSHQKAMGVPDDWQSHPFWTTP